MAFHDLVASVPADIDEAGEPRLVADHDDRHLAGIAGDVIAEVFQPTNRPDVIPGLAEDLGNLCGGDRRIGVPMGGQRFAAIESRAQLGGIVGDLAHPDVLLSNTRSYGDVCGTGDGRSSNSGMNRIKAPLTHSSTWKKLRLPDAAEAKLLAAICPTA